MTYTVSNSTWSTNHYLACGHAHQTFEAALKCAEHLVPKDAPLLGNVNREEMLVALYVESSPPVAPRFRAHSCKVGKKRKEEETK